MTPVAAGSGAGQRARQRLKETSPGYVMRRAVCIMHGATACSHSATFVKLPGSARGLSRASVSFSTRYSQALLRCFCFCLSVNPFELQPHAWIENIHTNSAIILSSWQLSRFDHKDHFKHRYVYTALCAVLFCLRIRRREAACRGHLTSWRQGSRSGGAPEEPKEEPKALSDANAHF